MSQIREATPADGEAVVALWHACDLTRPWNDPHADFARALGYPGATVLLLEDGATVAGSVMVGYDGHRGWIYYLAVEPDSRGGGQATALIDASCSWLVARGCPKVELMVRDGNPAARLYERLDWERQPVRVYARWLLQKEK